MICLVEVERYRKVILPVDDISAGALEIAPQTCGQSPQCTLSMDIWCTTDNNHVFRNAGKCPVMLTCPLGVVIVDDELTWEHVRQTVLLQGKVPGDW